MTLFDRYGAQVDSIVEFAPSLGWLSLMLLPLAYQYPDLHPMGRGLQLALVTAIALLLFLADFLCFRKATKRLPAIGQGSARQWMTLAGLCFLLPATAHLYLMPKIPLLIAIFDSDVTHSSLMLLRHDSAKLLDVPSFVKYLFNWTLVVFAPVYIVVAFFTGHQRQAILGLMMASLYAAATLAKFPLVLLLITCLFASCIMPSRFRRGLSLGLAVSVLLGAVFIGLVLFSSSPHFNKISLSHLQSSEFTQMNADDPRRALTLGDYLRLEPAGENLQRSKALNIAEYVLYRAWLTPADVSNRWYQYFTYVKKTPMGFHNFLPTQRTTTGDAPSRAVGIWAYQARFPDKYSETVSAYASFDADSFARGGVMGVAAATILLLAARVGAAFLLISHPVGVASYGVLLCGLAILPSSASLQAMFGAHGLFILLIVLLAIRLLAYWPGSMDKTAKLVR